MGTDTLNTSYAAVVIFMLIFDCILVHRLWRTPGFGRAQNWILTLLGAAAVCTVSDALCVQLGARAGRAGAFFLNAVFDASTEFIAFFMFMYCEMIYDAKRILWRKVMIPLMLPMLVMLCLLVASWWTGWIFSVDAAGSYTRGPLFPLFVYVLANGYTIAAVADFGSHLKIEKDPKKRRLLRECMSYFIPLVAGTVCQFFLTDLPTSNIGLTLAILLVFMNNQEKLLMMNIMSNAVKYNKDGGRIVLTGRELASQADQGTSFTVTLPFRIDKSGQIREPVREMPADSIAGLNILLAEDNELNMEIAEFVLESRGARVTRAWNGREAAEIFAAAGEDSFDAILMDVMMPEMDGYAATRKIRAMKRADAVNIPIIAMTANAFAEDKNRSREAGMNGHLAKPLDTELLVQTVAELAKKPEQRRKRISTQTLEVQKTGPEKRDRTNMKNGEKESERKPSKGHGNPEEERNPAENSGSDDGRTAAGPGRLQ